ncbi:MAG TPA: 23S rRNA (adenine(2503)-C(2))-methyltransferase RlmN [Rectinemataceae bacterium]|nr:23S rRNA (adenine(2503)-C(2))-methyltransferase RlmN [Rectinemataceae bacterium]
MSDSLYGMSPAQIAEACAFRQAFRARQVYRWLARGVSSFEEMTDLPLAERERLSRLIPRIRSSQVAAALPDEDGSLKLQIRLADGAAVECVLLEDLEGRKTACLSSQVGCPMRCAFCKTGTLGFLRDLKPGEIMEQFHFLAERRGEISNVVFMGMGEPMLNLASVRSAITILSDPAGPGISLRKITISTSGIVPGILDLAEHGPMVRLAVSIAAADDGLRSELMPVNRSHDLAALKAALLRYQETTGERITLELPIMGNSNASVADAQALAAWTTPLRVQVNVIPWNRVPGLHFVEPTM